MPEMVELIARLVIGIAAVGLGGYWMIRSIVKTTGEQTRQWVIWGMGLVFIGSWMGNSAIKTLFF